MQVVSGSLKKEKVHFQAPNSSLLDIEMKIFIDWYNSDNISDYLIKAAIAHLWYVTIHPFDDGNGRIARALTDMLLARSDRSTQRFYSMSSQIKNERKKYYDILEKTQKGDLDITEWIIWFLECLKKAILSSDTTLEVVLKKDRFWRNNVNTALNSRQKKVINKLLDGFVGNMTSSKWAKINKTSKDTAVRDINDLISKNILTREAKGGRSTSYQLLI
jgi:Fic family protein